MGCALLLQLFKSFEKDLLLALVGLELVPEQHDFKLPVDDDGLLECVWLLDHWKMAHKGLLVLSGSLLDRLFRRSWLLMVLLPLRAGWFLQALLAFGGRFFEALR